MEKNVSASNEPRAARRPGHIARRKAQRRAEWAYALRNRQTPPAPRPWSRMSFEAVARNPTIEQKAAEKRARKNARRAALAKAA